MADKQRRTQDLIKRKVSSYLSATTEGYTKYLEGSPTYIIYYQLNSTASLQDQALENVNSLFGNHSPKKYKKIYNVPVYGVDLLDVQNDIAERGLTTSVSGDMIFLPDTVRPNSNDFFVFDYDGMESHLFRINDVQFDKLTAKKYYRVAYNLYPNNAEEIFDNVIEEYDCEYTTADAETGMSKINIVPKSEAANNDLIKNVSDGLIDKYTSLFYSDDNDMFLCKEGGVSYWSPYLQHFLHETNALRTYKDDFMREFYFLDITQYENPEIYDDTLYRDSLFRNIQIKNPDINFSSNFMEISPYNLKMTRNLPFFMSTDKYALVKPIKEGDLDAYINAFPILFRNNTPIFGDVDHYHKVHIMDNLHLQRLEPYIKNGEIVYECNRHELEPTKIFLTFEREDRTGKYKELEDVSIQALLKPETNTSIFSNMFYFNIIKDYFNGTLVVDDALLDSISSHYYTKSLDDYIFLPLILYIIKQQIK